MWQQCLWLLAAILLTAVDAEGHNAVNGSMPAESIGDEVADPSSGNSSETEEDAEMWNRLVTRPMDDALPLQNETHEYLEDHANLTASKTNDSQSGQSSMSETSVHNDAAALTHEDSSDSLKEGEDSDSELMSVGVLARRMKALAAKKDLSRLDSEVTSQGKKEVHGFPWRGIKLPTLPKVSLPKVELPKAITPPTLPKVSLPKVELPKAIKDFGKIMRNKTNTLRETINKSRGAEYIKKKSGKFFKAFKRARNATKANFTKFIKKLKDLRRVQGVISMMRKSVFGAALMISKAMKIAPNKSQAILVNVTERWIERFEKTLPIITQTCADDSCREKLKSKVQKILAAMKYAHKEVHQKAAEGSRAAVGEAKRMFWILTKEARKYLWKIMKMVRTRKLKMKIGSKFKDIKKKIAKPLKALADDLTEVTGKKIKVRSILRSGRRRFGRRLNKFGSAVRRMVQKTREDAAKSVKDVVAKLNSLSNETSKMIEEEQLQFGKYIDALKSIVDEKVKLLQDTFNVSTVYKRQIDSLIKQHLVVEPMSQLKMLLKPLLIKCQAGLCEEAKTLKKQCAEDIKSKLQDFHQKYKANATSTSASELGDLITKIGDEIKKALDAAKIFNEQQASMELANGTVSDMRAAASEVNKFEDKISKAVKTITPSNGTSGFSIKSLDMDHIKVPPLKTEKETKETSAPAKVLGSSGSHIATVKETENGVEINVHVTADGEVGAIPSS